MVVNIYAPLTWQKKITFKLGSSLQTEKGTNMQNFTNPTRLKETALNVGNFCRDKWDFVFGANFFFFMKNNKDKKLFRSGNLNLYLSG